MIEIEHVKKLIVAFYEVKPYKFRKGVKTIADSLQKQNEVTEYNILMSMLENYKIPPSCTDKVKVSEKVRIVYNKIVEMENKKQKITLRTLAEKLNYKAYTTPNVHLKRLIKVNLVNRIGHNRTITVNKDLTLDDKNVIISNL